MTSVGWEYRSMIRAMGFAILLSYAVPDMEQTKNNKTSYGGFYN